jgi:predicted metal-binding protein
MTTMITICDTCKREGWSDTGAEQTDGEVLAGLVEAAATGRVQTRRVSCLMGCTHGCNIAIQSEGKLAYTLGKFEATADDAQAIVDYAALHQESDSGQVPYRTWPSGVKGHFITRHPPLPALNTPDSET